MAGGPIRDAALSYARLGWSVIPIRPHEKVPLLRWEPYQTRRATEAEIERWFKRWTDANVGIVTGAISHLAVLDIDPRHDGTRSLRELEERHGALEPTVEAETGGGGRHFYFAHPPQGLRNRAALAPGIDLRAEGGLVVAPPSIHPSGEPYRWIEGHAPDVLPPAPMPVWLLRLASGGDAGRGHSAAYWRALVRSGVEEGARNSTIASLAGHLLWHGVDPEVAAELLLCWNRVLCRPPLEDEEVERTVASIAQLHTRGGERG